MLFLWVARLGCTSIRKHPPPKAGQVGMYIYRNSSVKGYETYSAEGLTSQMVIQRNADGHMISRVGYDGSESIVKRFEYEVDINGLMKKKTRSDPDNQMCWYALYKYDGNGYRIEQRNYDRHHVPTTRVTFYYDSHGERIRNEVYDAQGRPLKTHIYLYDDRHRRVKDLLVDLKGEIQSSTKYVYGDTGFISRIEFIDSDGLLIGYNEIDCDADGNRLEKKDYDANGGFRSTTNYFY